MNFAKLCGFRTSCFVNKSFIKHYDDISSAHWVRITQAATLLSDNHLGPKIICIGENFIEYKLVEELDPRTSPVEMHKQIRELVGELHQLGWGHGDLGIQNLGQYKGKVVLLDPDTMYQFTDTPPEWLQLWMRKGFDCENLTEFVQLDYETWNTDWLYIDI